MNNSVRSRQRAGVRSAESRDSLRGYAYTRLYVGLGARRSRSTGLGPVDNTGENVRGNVAPRGRFTSACVDADQTCAA